MHAITQHTPTTETPDPTDAGTSASPPARLSLAPDGSSPALLDGAWWPRSRDLAAELPSLTTVLDPRWGRITRITVNPAYWPVVPHKIRVEGHAVQVGWFEAEQDRHKLLLLSYRTGRWDLLVVPPETDPEAAAWLMAAAADPLRASTASGLMDEAEQRSPAVLADRAPEAVWESEGGPDIIRSVAGTHN
jgi:Family of unknown function (DUF5994)